MFYLNNIKVNQADLEQLFRSFNQYRIMVIGDVMIDTYLWGKVERISPEAPVPVVQCSRRENRLGGAANVALNIQSLGAKPILCAVVGDDTQSSIFYDLLKDCKLPADGIVQTPDRPTSTKTRVISQNQHMLRVDLEVDDPITGELETKFAEHLLMMIETHVPDAIIFEDYDKGTITPHIIKTVVERANIKGIPTLVDPKKRNFLAYENVTLFKPNFKELKEGLRIDVERGNLEQLFDASQQLTNMGIKNVFVTLSELGVFISNGKEYAGFPAAVRDIADVSGAGDTVISVASICMAAQINTHTMSIIANLAGGLVCERVGVVPINKQLLLAESIRYFAEAKS